MERDNSYIISISAKQNLKGRDTHDDSLMSESDQYSNSRFKARNTNLSPFLAQSDIEDISINNSLNRQKNKNASIDIKKVTGAKWRVDFK